VRGMSAVLLLRAGAGTGALLDVLLRKPGALQDRCRCSNARARALAGELRSVVQSLQRREGKQVEPEA